MELMDTSPTGYRLPVVFLGNDDTISVRLGSEFLFLFENFPLVKLLLEVDERPMMLEECQLEIIYKVHCKNLVSFSNMVLYGHFPHTPGRRQYATVT